MFIQKIKKYYPLTRLIFILLKITINISTPNQLVVFCRKIEDDYYIIEIEDKNIHIKCDQLPELLKFLNTLKNLT